MKPQFLPLLLAVLFLSLELPAQTHRDPTQARLATAARLDSLNQSDLNKLLSQAQSGDPEAQYWVGLAYEWGKPIPKDLPLSDQWLLKSAEQGYAPAQSAIGMMYLDNGGDYGKMDMWLRRAAVQGDAEAQFWLGAAYEQGRIGSPDYAEALNWIRKAADQGHPDAEYLLGQMYEDGEGVPQNYTTAAKWYRRAAEHVPDLGGAEVARNELAHLYMKGLGVPQDYVLAYFWFAVAGFDPEEAASHMSPTQIAEARRMAQQWSRQHAIRALQDHL
jgi:uncharacterized protein